MAFPRCQAGEKPLELVSEKEKNRLNQNFSYFILMTPCPGAPDAWQNSI